MKEKKKFMILIFLVLGGIIIFSSSVLAINLQGQKLSPILFQPGAKIINHYIITNTEGEVKVNLAGDLIEYIHTTAVVDNQFDLIIEPPQTLPEPGTYWFMLQVSEVGEAGAMIDSLLSVNLRFKIEVPPHGKSLSISFNAPNINENQPIIFTTSLISKGLKNIESIQEEIIVYDAENKSIGVMETTTESLKALDSKQIVIEFETKGLPPANYWAEAIVTYDGEEKRLTDTFKIGDLNLNLKNYTSELERGFSEFIAVIENNWGNPINEIYGKLFINETEFLHTPTISLAPWQEGELKGIIKTELDSGEYEAKLILFFEGKSKEELLKIKIIEISQPDNNNKKIKEQYFVPILIILVIITITLWVIFKKEEENN